MALDKFSKGWRTLLRNDYVEFLQALVSRFPEANMLAGPADASPEGNQKLRDTAIAYQVFEKKTPVHKTAIEADRTFLSLTLLKAALNKDRSKFPNLSYKNWSSLLSITNDTIANDADLEVVLYGLIAQDLGKTQALVNAHKKAFGRPAEDHDKLLLNLTFECPELFPGFQALPSAIDREDYLSGLGGDFNLGQFVQGENLPCNLIKMMRSHERPRKLRLLTELYDFAGVTGHVVHDKSILMNDANFTAFNAALLALNVDDSLAAYMGYIAQRGQLVGLVSATDNLSADPEKLALSRIAAMSRAFTPDQGKQIKVVWAGLSKEDRATLTEELSITGMDTNAPKGIMVYYLPAVFANAIKAKKGFSEGLLLGPQTLANIYRVTRPYADANTIPERLLTVFFNAFHATACWETKLKSVACSTLDSTAGLFEKNIMLGKQPSIDSVTAQGQVTVNVAKLARLAETDPDAIVRASLLRAESRFKLFTLEV